MIIAHGLGIPLRAPGGAGSHRGWPSWPLRPVVNGSCARRNSGSFGRRRRRWRAPPGWGSGAPNARPPPPGPRATGLAYVRTPRGSQPPIKRTFRSDTTVAIRLLIRRPLLHRRLHFRSGRRVRTIRGRSTRNHGKTLQSSDQLATSRHSRLAVLASRGLKDFKKLQPVRCHV